MSTSLVREVPEKGNFVIRNCVLANADGTISIGSIAVVDGVIAKILRENDNLDDNSQLPDGLIEIDGSNKLLLPGFFNQHTHSGEHWSRGAVRPFPLELWFCSLLADSSHCDEEMLYLSALHCGAETLLTGGTAIMDHVSVIPGRVTETVDVVTQAYHQLGIRGFVAPLLYDMDAMDMIPQEPIRDPVTTPPMNAMNPKVDESLTKFMVDSLEESAKRFHNPSEGIYITAAPTGIHLSSDALFRGAAEVSERYDLPRHIHLLETKSQQQLAHDKFGCSAVQHLTDIGFLNHRTSCAHAIHLTDDDITLMAKNGSTAVHNPLSNLRLGSGIAPVLKYLKSNVNVSFGCDGSASNDAQDLLEAIKIGSILHNITDRDYRNWLTPIKSITMASEGGARGVGLFDKFGSLEVGKEADMVLYDLNHLNQLPRTDPLGLFVWGRPTNALTSVWVRGRQVVRDGELVTIDLEELKRRMIAKSSYRVQAQLKAPLVDALEAQYRRNYGLAE